MVEPWLHSTPPSKTVTLLSISLFFDKMNSHRDPGLADRAPRFVASRGRYSRFSSSHQPSFVSWKTNNHVIDPPSRRLLPFLISSPNKIFIHRVGSDYRQGVGFWWKRLARRATICCVPSCHEVFVDTQATRTFSNWWILIFIEDYNCHQYYYYY